MILSIIRRLLVKIYSSKNREIFSLSPEREYESFLMKTSLDIENCIKSEISSRMLSYYEAITNKDRNIIKGEITALKILKDKHLMAVAIENNKELKGKQDIKIRNWKNFKNTINKN